MATYPPPTYTEPLSIFNPIYFESAETLITIEYANKNYLRFPVAQGTETLQEIIVNGTATFNNNVNVGSSSTANNTPLITTNKAELVVGTGGQGEINVECPIYVGGFGSVELQSSVLRLDSNANIQQTGATTFNNLNGTIFTTALGSSATATLTAKDSVDNKSIQLLPNVGAGSYNPASNAGNETILAISGARDTQTLELTTWSATNSSVKVAPTSVSMGAGGNTNIPTTSVVCNGTSVVVSPSITYPDNTIQNSAFTGAGALTGSYTNTNMTIDANGKITAIANGSGSVPSALTANSLTINNTQLSPAPNAGISNMYNSGGYASQFFSNVNYTYLNIWIDFQGFGEGSVASYNDNMMFQVDIVWDANVSNTTPSNAYGQCSFLCKLFPKRVQAQPQWGSHFSGVSAFTNNSYSGLTNYNSTNVSYAPFGRQYWCQNIQGSQVCSVFGGASYCLFQFPNPVGAGNFYCASTSIRCLDATAVQNNTIANANVGVKMYINFEA